MKRESPLYADLQLAAPDQLARLFRNTVGLAWQGKHVRLDNGDVLVKRAVAVRVGLATGSSDLVGWAAYTIAPEDVGHRVAVFLSVEAKSDRGGLRDEQRKWLDQVHADGGIALVARSVEDLTQGVALWRPL